MRTRTLLAFFLVAGCLAPAATWEVVEEAAAPETASEAPPDEHRPLALAPAEAPTVDAVASRLSVRNEAPRIVFVWSREDPTTGIATLLFQARDGNGGDDLSRAEVAPDSGTTLSLVELPRDAALGRLAAFPGADTTRAAKTWESTVRFHGTDRDVTLAAVDGLDARGEARHTVASLPLRVSVPSTGSGGGASAPPPWFPPNLALLLASVVA